MDLSEDDSPKGLGDPAMVDASLNQGIRPRARAPQKLEEDSRPEGGLILELPTKPYSQREQRQDIIRGMIGAFLLLMLGFLIVAPWISIWVNSDFYDNSKELFSLVSAPLIGLLGAAIGFYFGEKSSI